MPCLESAVVERRLPVRQVIGLDAGGRPPVTRREILQELDAWAAWQLSDR